MFYSSSTSPTNPSNVNLREFALTSTTNTLVWPYAGLDSPNSIANIMIIDSTDTSPLILPTALQGQVGYTTQITNLSGSSIPVQNNAGGALGTISAGQTVLVELRTNVTQAGTWLYLVLGATTSTANAAALAGYGLTVLGNQLNLNAPVTTFSATQSFTVGNRAQIFEWTGGVGVANLNLSFTLTNGWWAGYSNQGTGNLTITPTSPDLIDGATTKILAPGNSCLVFSTSTGFISIGFGQSLTSTDSQLNLNVAGSSNVTLTSTQYANNIIVFQGALTGNIEVIFPNIVKNWFLRNNTTGPYSITAQTSGGTGVVVAQGGSAIVSGDGTNIDAATSAAAGTVTSVAFSARFTGGTITTSGNVDLATIPGLVAGMYSNPSLTIDQWGRITVITAGTSLGTAAYENLSSVILDNGAGALTIGVAQVTGAMLTSSIALAGSPTTTTQSALDNSTKIATTAYVDRNSSGLIRLQTINASAQASVVFDSTVITSAYSKFIIEFDSVYASQTNMVFAIALSIDDGANYLNSGFANAGDYQPLNSSTKTPYNNTFAFIDISGGENALCGNAASTGSHGTIKFSSPSASEPIRFIYEAFMFNSNNPATLSNGFYAKGIGQNSGTTAINAIKIYDANNGANITGRFVLYALAK